MLFKFNPQSKPNFPLYVKYVPRPTNWCNYMLIQTFERLNLICQSQIQYQLGQVGFYISKTDELRQTVTTVIQCHMKLLLVIL